MTLNIHQQCTETIIIVSYSTYGLLPELYNYTPVGISISSYTSPSVYTPSILFNYSLSVVQALAFNKKYNLLTVL